MKRSSCLVALSAFGIVLVSPTTALADRSIEELIAAQGTFCFPDPDEPGGCLLFVPPVANFLGWIDPERGLGISVDYAGLADEYLGGSLGTTFRGTVAETPLPDGRVKVIAHLETFNALTWVVEFLDPEMPDFNDPLVFGSRVDTQGNQGAVLGHSHVTIQFIQDNGAPLPDLIQLLASPEPGQELLSLRFVANAAGSFTDGAPGHVHTTQVRLFDTGLHGAVSDGFPVENVILLHTGGNERAPMGL